MPENLKIILVEDESRSVNLMTNLLNQIPGVSIERTFTEPEAAYEYVLKYPPDLLILDIRMPGLNGLKFIERLQGKKLYIPFIFVTAQDEHTLDALRKYAIDYLLKPVSLKDLKMAIDRFREKDGEIQGQDSGSKIEKLSHDLIRFNSKSGFEIVKTSDVVYMLAEGRYTRIFINDGREITVSQNIGSYEHLAGGNGFIRVHRSAIINPFYFRKLNRIAKLCFLSSGEQEYKIKVSVQGIKNLEEYFSVEN